MFSSVKVFNIDVNLFYVAVFCLLIIYDVFRKVYLHRVITKYMPMSIGLPLIGNLYRLLPVNKILGEIGYGFKLLNAPLYLAWIVHKPIIITMEPDVIKHVLNSEEFLNKSKDMYHTFDKTLPNGILNSTFLKWKHSRKLINPFFAPQILRQFIPKFNKGSKTMCHHFESISDGKEHAVYDYIKAELLKISIGTMMLNGEHLQNRILECIKGLTDKVADGAPLAFVSLSFLTRTPNYYKMLAYLHSYLNDVIGRKMDSKSNQEDVSFLDRFITYEEKELFDRSQVTSETYTMLLASYETSATTLYSIILMLAMHQDVQEKVFQEIIGTVGYNEDVDSKYLDGLPYLSMVIDETLRLVPPIPIIGRQTVESCNLTKDIKLPKEFPILISIFHLHRRQDLWGPNAELFNPDNFLPENVEKRHPYAYMPFSRGMRNCVGMRYAYIFLKILAINLIREFKFSTDFPYSKLEFINDVALRFYKKPNIRFEKRTASR